MRALRADSAPAGPGPARGRPGTEPDSDGGLLWIRRMAQETLIHRIDAELGVPPARRQTAVPDTPRGRPASTEVASKADASPPTPRSTWPRTSPRWEGGHPPPDNGPRSRSPAGPGGPGRSARRRTGVRGGRLRRQATTPGRDRRPAGNVLRWSWGPRWPRRRSGGGRRGPPWADYLRPDGSPCHPVSEPPGRRA